MNAEELGKRFARLVTDAVVRRPVLWRLFRAPLRFQFQKLAPGWDGRRSPARVEAYEAALAAMPAAPRRALDLGTGTGDGAFALARRFPTIDMDLTFDVEMVGDGCAAWRHGQLVELEEDTPFGRRVV